jgi:hypothetical protein
MAADVPVSSSSSPTRAFSASFSVRSRSVSVARLTRWSSRSASNGFSMKSAAPLRTAATAVSRLPWPEKTSTGRLGIAPLDLVEQIKPVQLGALQPDIEQDQRRAQIRQRGERPHRCWQRSAWYSLHPRVRRTPVRECPARHPLLKCPAPSGLNPPFGSAAGVRLRFDQIVRGALRMWADNVKVTIAPPPGRSAKLITPP